MNKNDLDMKDTVTENADSVDREDSQASFSASIDYLKDPRFADFTPYNQKTADENGQAHYSLFPDRSAEQIIIEKTILHKKLAKAVILILVGMGILLIEWLLPGILKRIGIQTESKMLSDLLKVIAGLLKITGGVLGIAGAVKLVTSLHSAITVKDILRYSEAIDAKMQKLLDKGDPDLQRWRERLRKLREAQTNSENGTDSANDTE